MTNKVLTNSLKKSIDTLLKRSMDDEKIRVLMERHSIKTHFIPTRYRVLGGILQSMNIQFGNFLEQVITNIVAQNPNCEILPQSGKKNNTFVKSEQAIDTINRYIDDCQNAPHSTEVERTRAFKKLLHTLQQQVLIEPLTKTRHDVDLLFYDKKTDEYVYCEIKYNDDHDTGKFVDINRKVLTTYALLLSTLKKNNVKVYLFYFTNKRKLVNPYIPETNILRGADFFEKYTTIKYDDIDNLFKNISENRDINQRFDEMASKILHRQLVKKSPNTSIGKEVRG